MCICLSGVVTSGHILHPYKDVIQYSVSQCKVERQETISLRTSDEFLALILTSVKKIIVASADKGNIMETFPY